MLHLAAYTGNIAAGATDADLPGIPDPAITLSNNHYIFTVNAKVVGLYALGASLTRAKLVTPKLRIIAIPDIVPVERAALPPNRPLFNDLTGNGISLNPIDETQILVSNNLGAATEQETVLMWVDDGRLNQVQGDVYTVHASTTINTVANTWTQSTFILDQVLPAGRYSVVGLYAQATNLIAARLAFPLQVWRPGCLCAASAGIFPGCFFRQNYMGEFGQFESVAQPMVEFFSAAADTNPDVWLDIIKIR